MIPVLVCSMILILVAVRNCQIVLEKDNGKKVFVSKKTLLFALLLFVGYSGETFIIRFLISTTLFVAVVMWF